MDIALIAGHLASFGSVSSFLSQAWKVIRTGDTVAISTRMYALTVMACRSASRHSSEVSGIRRLISFNRRDVNENYAATAAFDRASRTSLAGGIPNKRPYSRVNCGTLSYPTA
jgi:hypothetical protein